MFSISYIEKQGVHNVPYYQINNAVILKRAYDNLDLNYAVQLQL